MRSVLILAVVLSGCGGASDDMGGFSLLPAISDSAFREPGPTVGFSADGTLWLTYMTGTADAPRVWPARLSGDHWEVGAAYERIGWSGGMHPDGPAVFDVAHHVDDSHVARYAGGAWIQKNLPPWSTSAVAPDGRLYVQSGEVTEDLHIATYSPAWDAMERDEVALEAALHNDWSSASVSLAFSPSAVPVFRYPIIVAGSTERRFAYRQWDGAAWVQAAAESSLDGAFNVDSQGRIWVIGEQSVFRWSGTTWEDLGGLSMVQRGGPGEGYPPYSQVLAQLDGQERLVVAIATQDGENLDKERSLAVRRLGPAGWEDLGPPIVTKDLVYGLSLAVGPDGMPVLAWISAHQNRLTEETEGSVLRVARYSGE